MTVLMIVLLFAVFVVVDLWEERRRSAALLTEGQSLHQALEDVEPKWVGDFKLPPVLNYHRGHAWVHWVGPDQAYVGLDDFARRLLGKDARISLPAVGTQLSQGDPTIHVTRGENDVLLPAPVAGEVIGINPRLGAEPDLAFQDNFGRGWLFKVRSPHLFKDVSNLLNGTLARRWMEDTRERFQHQLMLASGSVIQDGGSSIEDIASGLEPEAWRTLARDFLTVKAEGATKEVR